MKHNKEYYIFGYPIDTAIGKCYPLLVKDIPEYFADLSLMSLNRFQIVDDLMNSNPPHLHQEISMLYQESLFNLYVNMPNLNEAYNSVFRKVFDNEDVIQYINEGTFYKIRTLVIDMNGRPEEPEVGNPELRMFDEWGKQAKASDEPVTIEDILTSVAFEKKITYPQLFEYPLYQLFSTYARIAMSKNHAVTAHFATVSSKVNIVDWNGHIDLFKVEDHSMSKSAFTDKTTEIFN